jgi:hypothetical protein
MFALRRMPPPDDRLPAGMSAAAMRLCSVYLFLQQRPKRRTVELAPDRMSAHPPTPGQMLRCGHSTIAAKMQRLAMNWRINTHPFRRPFTAAELFYYVFTSH